LRLGRGGVANRRSPLQGCVSSADKGASLRFVVRGVRTLFCPHPRPLSHRVGEGVGAHGSAPCGAFPLACEAGEGNAADKGTPATHIWRARGMGFRRQDPPQPSPPLSRGEGQGKRAFKRGLG
jgi:hypothetical protein